MREKALDMDRSSYRDSEREYERESERESARESPLNMTIGRKSEEARHTIRQYLLRFRSLTNRDSVLLRSFL